MGGTDLRAHVVTPDQLSDAERRLYDLARTSTPLAEIGVRLGLPITEVDRRLDVLVTRLGLPDRVALRDPLPEPVIDATEETIDFTDAAATLPAPARSLSRRSLIIGGASAVGLAAAGAAGGVFLAGRGDEDPEPAQPGSTATPRPTATIAPGSGLDLIEPVDGAYERRKFAPGEEIDWAHGIFFMDVDTGAVDGWRLAQSLDDELLFTYRLPGPRYIEMLTPDTTTRILVDRETGVGRKYPAAHLRLVAVGGHQLLPGSRERLLFEELNGEEERPPTGSGRFIVADEEAPERVTFQVTPIQFGPDPLLSPEGDRAVVAADEGDSYGVRMFDLASGQELAALILPVPASQRVSINWRREAPASRDVGVEVVLFDEANADTQVLRAWLPWSGTWPAALAPDFDAPSSAFFAPGGSPQLIQRSLRDVPAESLGGGETWPVVEVAGGRSGEVRERIRSASLFYGDGGGDPPWRFAGEWFFTLTASGATEGSGFERVGYTAWHQQTLEPIAIELPPPSGSEWFHRTQNRGPIPNPRHLGVVALGRMEVARFDIVSSTPSGRLTNHFVANVTSTSGPDHIDPWSGSPDELVFVIGHGGHDGGFPGAMIAPKVEEPPFDDDDLLRFVVARAGDCVNLRDTPSLDAEVRECLVDGTELTIWPDARGGPEDGVAFVRNEEGAWVAVALNAGSLRAGGALGWVSSAFLDWR